MISSEIVNKWELGTSQQVSYPSYFPYRDHTKGAYNGKFHDYACLLWYLFHKIHLNLSISRKIIGKKTMEKQTVKWEVLTKVYSWFKTLI